jgi:hypothetical protein
MHFKGKTMNFNENDAKSGRPFTTTDCEPPASFFDFIRNVELSDDRIRNLIENINVSADTKALLYSFSSLTITVGRSIGKIGRKILDFLFLLLKSFPGLTFGVAFGLVVGALITAIPLIGTVIGGPATLLALGFGVVLGGVNELKQGDLGERVSDFLDRLSPLAN